jgi:hypothetical protein
MRVGLLTGPHLIQLLLRSSPVADLVLWRALFRSVKDCRCSGREKMNCARVIDTGAFASGIALSGKAAGHNRQLQ